MALDFFWKVINFGVFFFLLYKFIKRPLSNAVRDRHEVLKRTLEEAERAKEEWERRYREYEEKFKKMDEELERIKRQLLAEGRGRRRGSSRRRR